MAERPSLSKECTHAAGGVVVLTKLEGVLPRPRWRRLAKESAVAIGDPRFDGWETVASFEEQGAAVAWRDRLRELGLDGACVADHPLDGFGRGEVYLVVPPQQWSRANEIVENLDA